MIDLLITAYLLEAAAGAIIAGRKNRNAWGWTFACLFGGVIAIIILACLPARPVSTPARVKPRNEAKAMLDELRRDRDGH